MSHVGHLQPSAGVVPVSVVISKAGIGLHSTPPRHATFFVVATSNPFHGLLSPTTRRWILLIRSERSVSAVLIAASVCCKVLRFDPSDTIPPSTTAIDPIAATWLDPNKPSIIKSSNATPPAIAALETNIIFRHRSETSVRSSSCTSIREISSLGLSSFVRFKIEDPVG
jgi:hypothetical protein